MKVIKHSIKNAVKSRCVQINFAIASLTPMIDHAQKVWPSVREYLPANIYAAGFVVIVLANIVLHFRPDEMKDGEV